MGRSSDETSWELSLNNFDISTDATRRPLPQKLESLVLLRAEGGDIFPDSLSEEVFTNPCNNGDGTTTATLMHGIGAGGT